MLSIKKSLSVQERWLDMQMKLMADLGIGGVPNAGTGARAVAKINDSNFESSTVAVCRSGGWTCR